MANTLVKIRFTDHGKSFNMTYIHAADPDIVSISIYHGSYPYYQSISYLS